MKFELHKSFKDSLTEEILLEGLGMDGSHHKQWYLEQALLKLGRDLNQDWEELEEDEIYGPWEEGTAP